MQPVVYDLNKKGAELAKQAAADVTEAEPHKPRFVAGAMGPTSCTLSVSPSGEDPSFRNVTWDDSSNLTSSREAMKRQASTTRVKQRWQSHGQSCDIILWRLEGVDAAHSCQAS